MPDIRQSPWVQFNVIKGADPPRWYRTSDTLSSQRTGDVRNRYHYRVSVSESYQRPPRGRHNNIVGRFPMNVSLISGGAGPGVNLFPIEGAGGNPIRSSRQVVTLVGINTAAPEGIYDVTFRVTDDTGLSADLDIHLELTG